MAKCMQCGGMKKATKMKTGGANYGEAITKATNKFFPRSLSTGPNSEGFANMKKGGAISKINRAVTPGCRGGKVKDANGNCVDERKAKVGGSLKPVPGDKVGLSKLPTAVRNKMGYQQSGGMMKKAQGGPIIDKIKEKLAAAKEKRKEKRTERKITKQIVKSVKSSGKIIKE